MSSKSNELIGFLLSHYPLDENEQLKNNSQKKKIEKFSSSITNGDKTSGENTFMTWIKKNILIVLLFILLCILFYKTHVRKM